MATLNAVKVTLSSGKVVLLREMKISHTELAAQEVSVKANGDSNLLSLLMQKALVKILLVSINGVMLNATEKEDFDSLFSMGEYTQLLKVMGKLLGSDDAGNEPRLEVVTSGDN